MRAFVLSLFFALPAFARGSAPPVQDGSDDLGRLYAAERAEADLLRRRGRVDAALRRIDELLEEEPSDAAARLVRARGLAQLGRWDDAEAEVQAALAASREGGDRATAAAAVREAAELALVRGRYDAARTVLDEHASRLDPGRDPRDAWVLGRVRLLGGDPAGAHEIFERGLAAPPSDDWRGLLAKGRCERATGRLERASRTLVEADRAAQAAEGTEPDVLVALGDLYYESEREIEAPGKRSAAELYREALEIAPGHEGALLGLFELHRFNRHRVSRTPESILDELLGEVPHSIDGLLAAASADLEDGKLVDARARLALLGELAPGRREKRTLDAALAWVEHRREDCEATLAELARTAPHDARPEREVGRHLLELYRFAEGLPFLERAVTRDPADYDAWTQYARALANTAREDEAREALEKAEIAARGRQDAWRQNMMLVLSRMESEMVVEDFGELSFAWRPDAAEVLRTYMVPFYRQARVELAERYGFTPGPTHIEVFRRHEDFSVRSVGFRGFPALGVCFGPVVTALSPLSELRDTFSWTRTSFHEFSHVIHLGLSHNRCPRWITEGLATWEEVQRSPAWTRNMRTELVDALANDELIAVRDLNRAFRGPRILFGYYQGGLLCRMLIERHGFPPMIRLLQAFDRGLDLDQALGEVFETTPEAIDAAFRDFVAEEVAALAIEPRWQPQLVRRLRFTLAREAPADEAAREAWAEDWCTVAWGSWQEGRRLDAEEALRRISEAGLDSHRATFLRGALALADGERAAARGLWTKAVEEGGREFRALIALASLHQQAGELDEAERVYGLAEEAFPGFDEERLAAELRLAALHRGRGERDASMHALERWLDWDSGEFDARIEVAQWHVEQGRLEQACRRFAEANEIDPFRRELHERWARALREAGRFEEAAREFHVAQLVPPELDLPLSSAGAPTVDAPAAEGAPMEAPDPPPGLGDLPPAMGAAGMPPLTDAERAELLALEADCLKQLGREEDSRERAHRALELDGTNELARSLW